MAISKDLTYLCPINGELTEVQWTGRMGKRALSGRTIVTFEMKPVGDTIGTRCWVKETDLYTVED